ncbi:MarR family transcriptional regulator [Gordonia polyisoprenivorans]|nr:MarR family transcriptional regulator [Gordonia polyisoprenivorans]
MSEQTVARRYRRMREAGIVRVSAIVSAEALGETTWLVRVVCRPSGARKLAQALARRDDVGWVFLAGVGNEVILAVRARSADARADLLLMRLPATTEVLAMSSAVVLHEFPVGTRSSGHHLGIDLGGDVEDRLLALEDSGPSRQNAADGDATLDQSDWTLIRRLEADGRASYATLASAANMTAGAATRRVHALLARGVITLGVDIAPQAVGRTTEAQIWMSAPPAILQRCGGVLAALPEVAFVAAVSGTRNLVASIVCRSHADLYRFLNRHPRRGRRPRRHRGGAHRCDGQAGDLARRSGGPGPMTPAPTPRRPRSGTSRDADRVDVILDYLREHDPDSDLAVKAVAMRLSRAAHWLELQIKRQLAPLGIELWELDILATLSRADGTAPISVLTDSSQVSAAAMTNRITRLERAGFVVRAIDPDDRRQIRVSLTDAGRERAASVIEANDRAQREAMSALDAVLLSRLAEDLREFLLQSEGLSPDANTVDADTP